MQFVYVHEFQQAIWINPPHGISRQIAAAVSVRFLVAEHELPTTKRDALVGNIGRFATLYPTARV